MEIIVKTATWLIQPVIIGVCVGTGVYFGAICATRAIRNALDNLKIEIKSTTTLLND